MPDPVGLSETEIIRTLAIIEAQGEIQNVPSPQLSLILDKARKKMELKPSTPPP